MVTDLIARDRQRVWHPYAGPIATPLFGVESASGVRIRLEDGRELIDGMSSWWCVIHGYNHPGLEAARRGPARAHGPRDVRRSHPRAGGRASASSLVELTPGPLQHVFLCDSGSVAVEVAIKMALQYWQAQDKPAKHRLLTLRGGYHGDTFGAMSVCDPVTGMHQLFRGRAAAAALRAAARAAASASRCAARRPRRTSSA